MPIRFDNIKTTRNREYYPDDIQKVYDNLWYLTPEQRASVTGSVIEESGGDPLSVSNTGKYRGLLQWGSDRYAPISGNRNIERYNQLQELRATINNTTDGKSWTHGGKGSGYRTGEEAYMDFSDPDAPLEKVMRGFSYGYVRPKGKEDSYSNRLNVTRQVYERVKGDNLVKTKDNRLVVDWRKTRPIQHFSKQYSEGGWLMENGGYSPGNGIRNDIARWEGSSMKTNRPFEAEARDFNRVIPKGVRDRLTANQLDALYSYGYNVGMGNLKKRVLPTLEAYVDGRASADDVGRSMWATKDMMYRGLKRRREWERSMFAGRPYESRQNGIAYKPGRGNNAAVEVATMTPFQFTEQRPQIWQQEEGAEGVPEWFDVILERARKNPVVTGEPEVMTTPEPQEEKYTPSRADILLALTGMDSDNDQDEWSGLFRQYGNDDEQGQGLSIFGNGQRLFAGGGATDDPEDYESQVNAYMSNEATGLPFVDENGVPMKEVVLNSVPVVYDRKLGRNLTDEEYMARHPKASTTFDRLDLPQYRAVTQAEGRAMKRSADRDWVENAISGVPREKGLEIVAPEADLLMLPRAVASGAIGATWNGSKELLKDATKGLSDYVAKHPKLQYGLAGLDAMMGTEGIERARNGKMDAQTAMDLAALAAPAYGVVKNGAKVAKDARYGINNELNDPDSRLNMFFANHNVELGDWSLGVPKKEGRYIRIVGEPDYRYGDAIQDANETGVIRSKAIRPKKTQRFQLIKKFDYPMFTRGETWEVNPDKYQHNARLIRSKADTGATVWEESNKDFIHKGHKGIFRPVYDGDLQSFPTRYAEWWDRPNIGPMKNRWLWKRHEFEQPFRSEFDWSPESWFGTRINGGYNAEDVAALQSHLPEYTNIEKTAKANGTWLKMPDGSMWQGDPRSWIQMQSLDGRKMMPTILYHGEKVVRPADVLGNRRLWTSTNANMPISYGDYHYQLSIPKQTELSVFNANGNRWAEITDRNGNVAKTDDIVNKSGTNNNVTVIKNVVDPGSLTVKKILSDDLPVAYPKESFEDYTKRVFLGDDYIIGRDVPRKSLLGNNGNFDLSLPDIYKALIPMPLVLSRQQLNNKNNERR